MLQGMTNIFNPSSTWTPEHNQCSLDNHLASNNIHPSSTLSLTNSHRHNLVSSGDQMKSHYRKDRSDYQSLRPEQKHIFTSNLKYQVMLDSVQGRGPGMAFIPYCCLPELESAMEAWAFMEMIHSRSYTHIIKNLYAQPEEIFDTILGDEKIISCCEPVTRMMILFRTLTTLIKERWEQALEGVTRQSLTDMN